MNDQHLIQNDKYFSCLSTHSHSPECRKSCRGNIRILIRATLILTVAVSCLTACGNQKSASDSQVAQEIVCWGDSMTEGFGASEAQIETDDGMFDASNLSYPEVLQQLTGIKTYNFGVPSATSEEIAVMQGGITAAGDIASYDTIDYDVMAQAKDHPGDILILEIGSNDGWYGDYATLIAQYNAMIAHAGCSKYIIIGDTDDPENSVDDAVAQTAMVQENDPVGTEDTSWDAALREAFGDHFINMRAFLIEEGLRVTGLSPTEADTEAAAHGAISVQLRSDWTHFNSYGYYAQAVGVYQKGIELGYWGETQ